VARDAVTGDVAGRAAAPGADAGAAD
jgi:hypothetical protein